MMPPRQRVAGFTLVELLVVVAIIGIVMTIAVPSIYRQLHPDSMHKAVTDVMEACRQARALAILNGSSVAMNISPLTRKITISPARTGSARPYSPSVSGEAWRMEESSAAPATSSFSAKISDRIQIRDLSVNFEDYTQAENASVYFYPNGMSDEFSLFLVNDQDEFRWIHLEVVTGLADYETDREKIFDHFY